MEFAEFADRAAAIEAVSADTAVVSHLAALFADADDDLPVIARFVQGRVFPAWQSRTLDVGPSLCHEAIARAAGRNVAPEDVEGRLAERGDIGAVAASFDFGGQRGLAAFGAGGDESLSVADVASGLDDLAAASGEGSRDRKCDRLFGLFTRCGAEEARYLARLVLSEMRIGVGGGAVRDAVADAFDVPVDAVERGLQVTNDYGRVAELARAEGEAGLADLSLEVGRPVQAMLAQAGTAAEALDDWGTVAVETKFDGARVQVHVRPGESVDVYSRNMEDVTDALPEVVEFVSERVDVPAIVDGEVVAVDDEGDPRPFQEVLRRFRRKHDVDRVREEVAVVLRAFDCLHADGRDLLDEPLLTRHEHLADCLGEGVADLTLADDAGELAAVESAALADGHEGIMLKNPDAPYTPGDRGKNWLKRKPDVETLDLVVTGAEWGEGRRATLFGTFELAARTDDGFETLGKVATGITDEELADLTERLEPHVVGESGQSVDLRPAVVFEVGYEEIQRSPTYDSGYALRFPRFRGVRSDKDPADADALARVRRLAGDDA
jgi:DNA ligase-1